MVILEKIGKRKEVSHLVKSVEPNKNRRKTRDIKIGERILCFFMH